jgi:hypothetical protein
MPEESVDSPREDVPPPGEAVHLPGPSYLPVVVAAGTTVLLVGVVFNWVVFGIGLAVTVLAIGLWIRSASEEIAELPLEH